MEKKLSKKSLIIIIACVVLALALAAVAYIVISNVNENNRRIQEEQDALRASIVDSGVFNDGITIEGIAVGGMTLDQARELIYEREDEINQMCIRDRLTFVRTVSDRPGMAVVLLVRQDLLAQVEDILSDTHVLAVGKPLGRREISQSIQMARVLANRLDRARQENDQLKTKLEDLKIIDRAKCCLAAVSNTHLFISCLSPGASSFRSMRAARLMHFWCLAVRRCFRYRALSLSGV